MTHRIEKDQVYYSVDRRDREFGIERRIKVVEDPVTTYGRFGYGKVEVVTLTEDGREIRRRRIDTGQLHASATKDDGTERVTGYVREK